MLGIDSEDERNCVGTKWNSNYNFNTTLELKMKREGERRSKLWGLLGTPSSEEDAMSEHTPMLTDDEGSEDSVESLSDISYPDGLLKYAQFVVENLDNEADMIEEIKSEACISGHMAIARQLRQIQLKSLMKETNEMTEAFHRIAESFVAAAAVFDVSEADVKAWLRKIRWLDCKEANPKHRVPCGFICHHTVDNVSMHFRYYDLDPMAEEARQMLKEVLPQDLLACGRPLVPAMDIWKFEDNALSQTRYKISAGSIYPATKEEVFSLWRRKGWKLAACEQWWEWMQPQALPNSTAEEMQRATQSPMKKKRNITE